MMQGGNRFLDFADEIMARHRGLGWGFEPAAMLYLEDQEQRPEEQGALQQNFTTNLYHIQNITEENYLIKQNLSFLTQILENKVYQKLYPSVEKQIEKVIREEMPEAETKIINSVSQQLYRLVQQGGIEQFELVRERVLSETKETEKITLKEQEKLFRKIENIWNSSVYPQAVKNNNTTIDQSRVDLKNNYITNQHRSVTSVQQNQFTQTEIVYPEVAINQQIESLRENNDVHESKSEYTDSVLERTLKVVETQNQILTNIQNQKSGNLGQSYLRTAEVPLEYVQEQSAQSADEIRQIIHQSNVEQYTEIQKQSNVEQYSEILKQIERKNITANVNLNQMNQHVSVRQESIHLEYPSEETTQFQKEIIQMLHSEIERIPEVPKAVKAAMENQSEVTTVQDSRTQIVEKTKSFSEKILSRMESIGLVPVTQTTSVTKTVAFNKLSHAILEYAEFKTTSEELQTNMMSILEDYQTETISVPGTDSTRMIYDNNAELVTIENLKHRVNHHLIQSVRDKGNAIELVQSMEPAAIVYRSEESAAPEQQEKTRQLEQQVNEVVKTIKNVEQKTVVQKEQLMEEQRKVVREVLKENPTIWTEGKGAGYIRTEVQQSVEEQINQSVNQIANRVYRRLEDKLKSERGRRGLI